MEMGWPRNTQIPIARPHERWVLVGKNKSVITTAQTDVNALVVPPLRGRFLELIWDIEMLGTFLWPNDFAIETQLDAERCAIRGFAVDRERHRNGTM